MYPPIRFEDGQFNLHFNDCREQTRFFLTYFGRIGYLPLNVPSPPIPGMWTPACLMSEDLQVLVRQGVVQPFLFRDRAISIGYSDPRSFASDICQAYVAINREFGGGWAVCPPPGFHIDDKSDRLNSLIMTFREVLPCPDVSVAVHDIIQFREQNSELLQDLHFSIDQIASKLGHDIDDVRFALERQVNDLKSQLFRARFPFDSITFSVSRAISATMLDSLLPGLSEFSLEVAGGCVSLEPRSSSRSVVANQFPVDFEYVYLGRKKINVAYETKSATGHVVYGLSFLRNAFIPCIFESVVPETTFVFRGPEMNSQGDIVGNVFG